MLNKTRNFKPYAPVLAAILCLSFTSLAPSLQAAEAPLPVTTLPGEGSSEGIRIAQRKADRAFEQGNYERSLRIYERRLAPKGDKHAHYMIGLHHQNGFGVEQDLPRALAWYALSAERGSAEARQLAAFLSDMLDEADQQRADEIFAELQQLYGDRVLLVKAIRRDQRELRNRTGSRVGGGTSPTRVITEDGRNLNGDEYYAAIEARIFYRTQLLGGTVTLGELELIDTPTEVDSQD
ncbi:MAG: sel1 repeat family protein [Xanthomonadales bacterium]|nr:sel1 repeat family protein [Xanthomonadales bacterium]